MSRVRWMVVGLMAWCTLMPTGWCGNLWRVEILKENGEGRTFRSWEMSAMTDVNGQAFNIPVNPKVFTLNELAQMIEHAQHQIESALAQKALLEQIKAAAEALP